MLATANRRSLPPAWSKVSQLPAGLREGDLISGKYRIEGVLGVGAMGTVVAAMHVLLLERVAIKFLHPHRVAGSAEASARFVREAQAAIRVKSEHVARVYDIAELESGEQYIVMEHLDGCDLAAWLRQHGRMASEEAVDCVLQACEAIAEAHALRIVHRDLKPANLFLTARGGGAPDLVKVLDFGISKTTGLVPRTIDSTGGDAGVATGASAIMGSPFYMSPEQMESARDADERSDIWALGVILCELVTGAVPFGGTTLIEVYRKMISPARPIPRAAGVLPGLEGVIRKCLERWPADRYATVQELAIALKPFASTRGAASVERIRSGAPPEGLARADTPRLDLAGSPPAPIRPGEQTLASRQAAPEDRGGAAPREGRAPSIARPLRLGGVAVVVLVAASGALRATTSSVSAPASLPSPAPPPRGDSVPADPPSASPDPPFANRADAKLEPLRPRWTAPPVQAAPVHPSAPKRAAPPAPSAVPAPTSAQAPAPSASAPEPPAPPSAPPPTTPAPAASDDFMELLRRRE